MTRAEKKKLIDVIDSWVQGCENFYSTFEKELPQRIDAQKELECRIDRATFLCEFLDCCNFISDDKYLELSDKLECVFNKLKKVRELAE